MSRIMYVNINVTDMDRSIAFYELIGFKLINRWAPDRTIMHDTARMYNEAPNEDLEAALLRLGGDVASTCLDLCQWRTRPAWGSAPEQTNRVGMCRLTIAVDDPGGVVARLGKAGYEPIGENVKMSLWEGRPPASLVAFRDPDGVFVQVVHGLDPLVG